MTAKRQAFSVSPVTQNGFTFFTCSIPSDILAQCCFVSTREKDPVEGFQRLLSHKRAKDIAEYIDTGFGTIPTSIVLSAQKSANVKIDRRKTINFDMTPESFLILDGQHRIYGFSLAKKKMRVPVVIYNGLSRADESRLFIDINTKQKQVPKELLLDIKSLAEVESTEEEVLRELFDIFISEKTSQLLGLMNASKSERGKINRVTFNNNVKCALGIFKSYDTYQIYYILNQYLAAFISGAEKIGTHNIIVNKTVFGASMRLFSEVVRRVVDRFGKEYDAENFYIVMKPIFDSGKNSIKSSAFSKAKGAVKLSKQLKDMLNKDFLI